MANSYDVIIIGSGAGGGTLAYHLAPSGKRILILERGDWLRREPENWSAEEVFVNNRYVSQDIWRDKHGKPFQPGVHYFVGGATKMYGDESRWTEILSDLPIGRPAKPEEISDGIIFLASERASYISGVTITIDGGLKSRPPTGI